MSGDDESPTTTFREMSRIGVTGAAGFVGSHLVERLIAEGHEVVGVDCFSPNYSRERKERNLAALADEPRFALVENDICSPSLARALRGCRAVMHMAAVLGVRTSDERRLRRVNVEGTARLLDSLGEAGVSRMILASSSSSSIYDGRRDGPAREEDPPAPRSLYGHTSSRPSASAGAHPWIRWCSGTSPSTASASVPTWPSRRSSQRL